MNVIKSLSLILLFSLFPLAGCTSTRDKLLPAYDDVLVYDLPFDLTYLRTLEALETVKDWELEDTEKEQGIIRLRNTAFSRFDDADLRQATILVSRISRGQTSVQFAPYSQRVVGGDKMLERISEYVSKEI